MGKDLKRYLNEGDMYITGMLKEVKYHWLFGRYTLKPQWNTSIPNKTKLKKKYHNTKSSADGNVEKLFFYMLLVGRYNENGYSSFL